MRQIILFKKYRVNFNAYVILASYKKFYSKLLILITREFVPLIQNTDQLFP